jgi:tetrahydromethanopterin S-methyltransferase subunit G
MAKEFTSSNNAILAYLMEQEEINQLKEKLGIVDKKVDEKADVSDVDTKLGDVNNEFINVRGRLEVTETEVDNVKGNLIQGLKPDGRKFNLDEVDHGVNFKKVKSGAVTETGQINLKSTHVINKLFNETQSDNLKSDKTVNGQLLYHTSNKPTKIDIGLGNVENKSSLDIRREIVANDLPLIPQTKIQNLITTISTIDTKLNTVESDITSLKDSSDGGGLQHPIQQ